MPCSLSSAFVAMSSSSSHLDDVRVDADERVGAGALDEPLSSRIASSTPLPPSCCLPPSRSSPCFRSSRSLPPPRGPTPRCRHDPPHGPAPHHGSDWPHPTKPSAAMVATERVQLLLRREQMGPPPGRSGDGDGIADDDGIVSFKKQPVMLTLFELFLSF